MDQETLKQKIQQANQAYRTGEEIISDEEYDALIDELNKSSEGKDELIHQIGFEVKDDDQRKEKLPIPMYSMNKVKSLEEIFKWAELQFIAPETEMVLTPKYDGLSLCVLEKEKKAWTRGNGIEGQRSDQHLKKILSSTTQKNTSFEAFSFGEVIMKKVTFKNTWSLEFKNSRNMGSGAMNKKAAGNELKDFDYIRFGLINKDFSEVDKTEQLEIINQELNFEKLPFEVVKLKDLNQEKLAENFQKWGLEYEIDGLIVEVNKADLRKGLGREKNGNPIYARAWKGFQEQTQVTRINSIDFQVSKNGLLKPVARIEPVELDGVTVSNVTLNNAKFMLDRGLGVNAEVLIIRSGQVIPKVIDIISAVEVELPKVCPDCSQDVQWNENKVELICVNEKCSGQRLQKIIAFFSILEVENMGEGIIVQLIENGHDSIPKILNLKKEDYLILENFKERRSEVIYQGIKSKIKEVSLPKIQHASGCFEGLGTKKLKLLEQFDAREKKPVLETLLEIDGFSEISANSYLAGFNSFWDFIEELPISIKAFEEEVLSSNLCETMNICFSGVRRKDLEQIITDNGGKIAGTISSKVSHLVMKEKGTGSSKEKKAEKLKISILIVEELENLLKEMFK